MTPRRFPPPWSIEDTGAAFVVNDLRQESDAGHIPKGKLSQSVTLVTAWIRNRI
jgi:hypothetical protein